MPSCATATHKSNLGFVFSLSSTKTILIRVLFQLANENLRSLRKHYLINNRDAQNIVKGILNLVL